MTLDRYLFRQAFGSVLLTLTVLLSIDLMLALVRELDEIGIGDYSLGRTVVYVLFTAPRRAYDLFPSAALIGSVIALGQLAAQSELIALRSAGYSKLRIGLAGLAATAVMLPLVLLMGETIAPLGDKRAHTVVLTAKSADIAVARGSGLWIRDGELYINTRYALPSRNAELGFDFREVSIYQFDVDDGLKTIITAAAARHEDGVWRMNDVEQVDISGSGVSRRQHEALTWPSAIEPGVLALSAQRPRYLPVRELLDYRRYLVANKLSTEVYDQALAVRLSYPLVAFATVFLALPFAFGSLRSGGLGKRMVFGIMAGLGFFLINSLGRDLANVYAWPAWLGASLPSALAIAATTAWLTRQR